MYGSLKLEDEPQLEFSRMFSIDGNNSLKRMKPNKGRMTADTRTLEDSEYYLSREYVDSFANEVRGNQAKGPPVPAEISDNEDGDANSDSWTDTEVGTQKEGDPTDGVTSAPADPDDVVDEAAELKRRAIEACVTNWKAAAADEKKSMWEIFDETGIFAAACRHGLLLVLVDMVRSGEL